MRIQFAIKCGRTTKEKNVRLAENSSAIEFSLRTFTELLMSTHVKWFTDSQAAVKIVEVGSMKFDCQAIINIFTFCIDNQINLDIQWILRKQSTQAD